MSELAFFERSWAINEMRETQMRTYWRVGSVALGLFGAWIVAAGMMGNPVADVRHGIAALALAALAAYIGYRKDVHPRMLVDTARLYGVVAALAVVAYLAGVQSVLTPVETAGLAASGAVALYVGFTPL